MNLAFAAVGTLAHTEYVLDSLQLAAPEVVRRAHSAALVMLQASVSIKTIAPWAYVWASLQRMAR